MKHDYDPFNDYQGHDGMYSVNRSRACFGMEPLDEPVITPEDAAEDALIFWAALTIVVVAFAIPMVLAAIDYFR